ncbi:MAG: cyclic nucleotide-binding domain-containing protein [Spirochaetales bacterium]|uniref:Cyclic nucleotide-binding domain-containing protein n=1 Tax=Candidatus Thalassospirochaeta sargassi TaxID=3119039 RepID=A0AAJ1IGD9_9SPIO|nr:cyclic nucleotide-binding domain-containing protein [Spirochaetales bacterium]
MKLIQEKRAYIEEYKKLSIFKFMSAAEILHIISESELMLYSDTEKIVNQGDIAQNILVIVNGTVQVTVRQENGKDVYICSIEEGEIVGEAGMFLRVRRTANIVCLDDSVILSIPRTVLMNFIRDNPSTGNKLLLVIIHSLLKKLRGVNQELAFEKMVDVQIDELDNLLAELSDK